ncbi:porin [Deminuibacter soli]|nr:porin [Deminuibacter soli]
MNYYRIILVIAAFILAAIKARSQTVLYNGLLNGDTSQPARLTLEGYVDAYFAFDGNQPKTSDRLYVVSNSRHNEININLAYISLKYTAARFRATLTPGFGTYMNANYAAEKVTLRNLVEANIGFKPFAGKNIWVDVGVLPSPYTYESAISFDQLLYSRSMAAENVPYYLTGARVSVPLTAKLTANLYLLNGWQVINDINNPLGFGSNLEYKPTGNLALDWNVYAGNEGSETHPDFKNRYFTDIYANWQPGEKISLSADVYGGIQQRHLADHSLGKDKWWQANAAVKYAFNKVHSLSARAEYFSDPHDVLLQPVTNVTGFSTYSESLCYNLNIDQHVLFRVEGRYFQSPGSVYVSADQHPVKNNFLIVAGLTARF